MAVISDVRLAPFSLPLHKPLATAHGSFTTRDGVLLRLRTSEGLEGWGEATPVPGFPGPDPAATAAALERAARATLGARPEAAWPPSVDSAFPAAAFALETAVADLCARRAGVSLARWLGGDAARASVDVNALVAGPEDARRAAAQGFRTLKAKVGAAPLEDDLERIRAIRACMPPQTALRLDANQAWCEDEARDALRWLADLDIEYVEEPLRDPTPRALAALRGRSSVPIASDESAVRRHDFEAQLEAGAVDRVVIKPGAVGGLLEARERAAMCRDAGLVVVITTGLEGAIAGLAALHLAASLGPLPACGLATAQWLARDLCSVPQPQDGRLPVPNQGGLGFAPDPLALRRAAA